MVEQDLKMHPSTAQRLMKIAEHPVLSKAAHAQLLPPSWYTLYELTKVPDDILEAKIKDGKINPQMERKDIQSLLIKEAEEEEEAEEETERAKKNVTSHSSARTPVKGKTKARELPVAEPAGDENPSYSIRLSVQDVPPQYPDSTIPAQTPRRVPNPTGKRPDGIPKQRAAEQAKDTTTTSCVQDAMTALADLLCAVDHDPQLAEHMTKALKDMKWGDDIVPMLTNAIALLTEVVTGLKQVDASPPKRMSIEEQLEAFDQTKH
jgi:hypothetical protein